MFLVYVILAHLAFLLVLPALLLHPKLREGFGARLGRLPSGWPGLTGRPVVWAHAASAGDVLSLEPVLQELRALRPDCAVLLTTVTSSGMAVIRRGGLPADACGFLPYDLPWAVGRVMRRVRPDLLLLEYTEVWPALLRGARLHGARVVLVNGRFDERALGRYRFLYRLIGNPLRHLDRLCMRTPEEAEHARAIGADPERILVTGNSKFDRSARLVPTPPGELTALAAELRLAPGARLWVAGSTHEGEEGPLLEVFASLRADAPDLKLVLAPRYPERAPRVLALARERGLRAAARSAPAGDWEVLVLDGVGELIRMYELASVVFVGGSFVARGGQNILEPAACGKPVLFGPHMHNFRDAVAVLLGRGGLQVPDPERLARTLGRLLADPAALERLGQLARESARAHTGASRRAAEAAAACLPAPATPAVGGAP